MGVPLPESRWRPWAELPERYLSDIIRNLPCILDHARFYGVCTSDESWHDFLPKDRIEDVIYFSGKYFVGFYVLTNEEDLLMFRPKPDGDGAQLSTFTVRYSFPGHRAAEPAPGQTVSRYLVVSRGELLMIVRFAGPEERTRFDVLVLEEKKIVGGADHNDPPRVLASWRRCCSAATLSGRRIFLGRCCSVAVDVGYPFPLYIYFLDDGRRSHGALPTAGSPPYPCSETGGFWFFNKGIVRCLPREPPSDCSPWIWFYLSDATFRAGVPPPATPACGWGVDTDSE
uniref:KIB1-4 beta-propeller domain-containing protein n=1 Tax=Aegilops tauschii TaxID=37682 RepID=M8CRK3_AEGTA